MSLTSYPRLARVAEVSVTQLRQKPTFFCYSLVKNEQMWRCKFKFEGKTNKNRRETHTHTHTPAPPPPPVLKSLRDTTCGHKAKTSHHRSPGRERRGKRKRWTIFLERTRDGHRQDERGVERGSVGRCPLKGRERVIARTREAWKEEALDDLP